MNARHQGQSPLISMYLLLLVLVNLHLLYRFPKAAIACACEHTIADGRMSPCACVSAKVV